MGVGFFVGVGLGVDVALGFGVGVEVGLTVVDSVVDSVVSVVVVVASVVVVVASVVASVVGSVLGAAVVVDSGSAAFFFTSLSFQLLASQTRLERALSSAILFAANLGSCSSVTVLSENATLSSFLSKYR